MRKPSIIFVLPSLHIILCIISQGITLFPKFRIPISRTLPKFISEFRSAKFSFSFYFLSSTQTLAFQTTQHLTFRHPFIHYLILGTNPWQTTAPGNVRVLRTRQQPRNSWMINSPFVSEANGPFLERKYRGCCQYASQAKQPIARKYASRSRVRTRVFEAVGLPRAS